VIFLRPAGCKLREPKQHWIIRLRERCWRVAWHFRKAGGTK